MNKLFRQTNLLILLLIVIHQLILLKIQFIAWPEMLSYPYLLNKGYLLYQDIINPYPPVLPYFLLGYFKLFGLNLFSLKLITTLIISLVDLLIFLIVTKIFGKQIALLSLAIFIILQPILEGNGLWFDLFLTPFLLLVLYLLNKTFLNIKEKLLVNYVLFLGVILGLTFLIKQTTGFIFLSLLLFLSFVFKKKSKRLLLLFLYGFSFLIPILLVTYIMFDTGTIKEYLFWVFIYPFAHIQSSGFQLYPTVKQLVILLFLSIPLVMGLLKVKSNPKLIPLFVILVPSLLFAVPRFSYFHLQPSLPFIAIISSYFLNKITKNKLIIISAYLLGLSLIFGYFMSRDFDKEPRFYDAEVIKVSSLLKDKLLSQKSVFFYNVSSEYLVIAGLLPTKPWADTFPWYLEVKGLQEKIIKGMSEQNVEYVVFKKFNNQRSDIPGSYKPLLIDEYIQNNYVEVETISDTIQILKRKLD